MASDSRAELLKITVPTGSETKTRGLDSHPALSLGGGPEKQMAELRYPSDALAWLEVEGPRGGVGCLSHLPAWVTEKWAT